MKKFYPVIVLLVVVFLVYFVLQQLDLFKTITKEELKASIELAELDTKWVAKEYQPWPPKLVLVPAISFKVKNLTDKPLRYINFNANFRFKDDWENLGDCFLAAIRGDAIPAGGMSEEILLKSNYGVEGQKLNSFESNPMWKTVICKLFASSKGSQYIVLGEFEISRKIDFKEDEDVGVKPEDKREKKEAVPAEKK
jgi:hypothetical protein